MSERAMASHLASLSRHSSADKATDGPRPTFPRLTLSRQSRNQRGDRIVRRCQSCREPDDGVAHGALLRLVRAGAEEYGPEGLEVGDLFITDAAGGVTLAAGSVTVP